MAEQAILGAIHLLLETYPDATAYLTLSPEYAEHVEPALDEWLARTKMERGFRSEGQAENFLRQIVAAAYACGADFGQRTVHFEVPPLRQPEQRRDRPTQHESRARNTQLPAFAASMGGK